MKDEMKNLENENEFIYINKKMYANSLRFITGQNYIEIPHKYKEGRFIFAFHNNEIIQEAISDIMSLREKFQKHTY